MITKKSSLRKVLKTGEQCKKCGKCCSYGTGFLVDGEEEKIAKFLGITQKTLKENFLEEKELFNKRLLRPKTKEKPFGECVFLKGKLCGIQPVKPLHCKVGNCCDEELSAWFTLNYLVDPKDPEAIRQYKIYLESGGKMIEGGKLEELVPNKEKLKKILNFEVLK